jgi:hypothetical protein
MVLVTLIFTSTGTAEAARKRTKTFDEFLVIVYFLTG